MQMVMMVVMQKTYLSFAVFVEIGKFQFPSMLITLFYYSRMNLLSEKDVHALVSKYLSIHAFV